MVTKNYEVDFQFKETGTGQAEIVVPRILENTEWHFVQVNESEQKAIVQVEAMTEDHKAITADKACRQLTDKRLAALQQEYPQPRLKRRYPPNNLASAEGPVEKVAQSTLETVQQVRWKFHVIDVPIIETEVPK